MAITVTATPTGASGATLRVLVLTGATAAGGAKQQPTGNTGGHVSLTPAGSNSFIAWSNNNAGSNGAFTSLANNTILDNIASTGGQRMATGYYSGTVTAGTAVSAGATGASTPTTTSAYEILASGGSTPSIDASSPAVVDETSGTAALTTASFSPPGGAVVVAIVTGSAFPSAWTVSDSSSMTWTKQVDNTDGQQIWTATTAAGGSSVTGVVSTATASAAAGSLAAGAAVTGAVATAAAAAPAGTPKAGATVTGVTATAAAAAAPGTPLIAVTVSGVTATAAAAAPAGTPRAGATVTGVTATAAAAAPAGSVNGTPAPPAAFPAGPVGATVELDLGGTWTGITGYVAYQKQLLTISRGHPDESTTTTPSSMAALLDNTSYRFTSKNPTGAYYGLIGRNTPVRVSIPESANYLRIEGDNTSYAQAPDTAGLSITGDMDVQLDVTLDNWHADQMLAAKWAETGAERSWVFYLQNGVLHFGASTNGTSSQNTNTAGGPVPVPGLRRQCLRVTFASATGTVKFYTSPSPLSSAVWTQIGSTTTWGAFTIFNGTAPVQAGYASDAASIGLDGIYGSIWELIIKSGIGGTVAADANYSLATAGASTYTDAQSNVWTCEGTSEISGRKYRFHGEASAWTPYSEGTLGKDLWCGLTAGGLLRRIQQDTQTLGSAFTRALPLAVGLVGYWTCEDGNTTSSGATPAAPTQFASAIQGVSPGTFTGSPQFASDSSFLCSQALPSINGSRWHFRLPSRSTKDTANIFRFLMHQPSSSDTNNGVIARMYTTGTIGTLDLVYTTGGNLTLNGYDQSGNILFTTGPGVFGTNGQTLWVSVELQKSGSNVAYSVVTLLPGADSGLEISGTQTSASIGNATELVINGNSGIASLQGTAVGQITYQRIWESLFDFGSQLDAYQGETAGNRFSRLCGEQGIPLRVVGDLDDTVVMGAQTPLAFSDLLQECVDADAGQMYEPRQALALGYRTRASLQNQAAGIGLDYSLDGYAGMLTPTEDDQYTKNDVTATRAYSSGGGTGSSSEVVITDGPLSVQDPPDGVGPYLSSVTVNVQLDSQLDDAAGWRARLGTVDQPRYPAIPYDLARTDIGANLYAVPDLDIGDRLTVGNPPPWEPPDGISQLVNQATETIGERSYSIAWTGVPEQPYQTGLVGDPVYGRVDTDGSTLHASISSTATTLQVDTTPASPTYLWTRAAADFPFDINIGGERITVTNITGAGSPQTFTVTRSVNGVVKAQTAGADVRLFYPTIVSL